MLVNSLKMLQTASGKTSKQEDLDEWNAFYLCLLILLQILDNSVFSGKHIFGKVA